MRRFPFFLILAALACAMLAFSACGDDDDDGGGGAGGDRLTDVEYFARLTEIDDEVDAGFARDVDSDTAASAKEVIDTVISLVEGGVSQVEDLNPPEDLQADHDELLDALHAYQDDLEAAASDFTEDDPPEALDEQLFAEGSPLTESSTALDAKFCELQAIADERVDEAVAGFKADVGCDAVGE